jgi:hypothetical protein
MVVIYKIWQWTNFQMNFLTDSCLKDPFYCRIMECSPDFRSCEISCYHEQYRKHPNTETRTFLVLPQNENTPLALKSQTSEQDNSDSHYYSLNIIHDKCPSIKKRKFYLKLKHAHLSSCKEFVQLWCWRFLSTVQHICNFQGSYSVIYSHNIVLQLNVIDILVEIWIHKNFLWRHFCASGLHRITFNFTCCISKSKEVFSWPQDTSSL